jgi:hypothetical protein
MDSIERQTSLLEVAEIIQDDFLRFLEKKKG